MNFCKSRITDFLRPFKGPASPTPVHLKTHGPVHLKSPSTKFKPFALPAANLQEVFPFHIVTDADLVICQVVCVCVFVCAFGEGGAFNQASRRLIFSHALPRSLSTLTRLVLGSGGTNTAPDLGGCGCRSEHDPPVQDSGTRWQIHLCPIQLTIKAAGVDFSLTEISACGDEVFILEALHSSVKLKGQVHSHPAPVHRGLADYTLVQSLSIGLTRVSSTSLRYLKLFFLFRLQWRV